jgi:membrane protein required for beta-lactamase induction
VLGIAGVCALGLVLGLAVMYLWNWLMPAIFDLPHITYWQAVGLTVLGHLLFKSHTHPGHGGRPGTKDHSPRAFGEKVRAMIHGGCGEPGGGETA